MAKKLMIEPVTRIEGHAKISFDIDDNDDPINGRLHVMEIRGFEKFVQKMELGKMPLITARICGVCPAAHHLASVIAIENGGSIFTSQKTKMLRELLYMGHILHSHALSCFVLLGPDLISGISASPKERNIFHILSTRPDLAKKALQLRSIGQKIVEIVGGRGIHPVMAIPGGMASQPTCDEMKRIFDWGVEAIEIVTELRPIMVTMLQKLNNLRSVTLINALPLALSNNDTVDFLQGKCCVIDDKKNIERSFSVLKYGDHLIERITPGSYMKSVHLRDGSAEKSFFVGPLARLMVNSSFSTPKANKLLQAFKKSLKSGPVLLDIIEARLIEMMYCSERIAEIASQDNEKEEPCTPFTPCEGRYVGIVEAPRGILIHDYIADKEGRVTRANLIVATQNNYDAINSALTALARHFKPANDENMFLNGIEFALRCFDPCLSCATHAAGRIPLVVELRKNSGIIQRIQRSSP
jgi:F420-non-reducing hydrogenase large subunit